MTGGQNEIDICFVKIFTNVNQGRFLFVLGNRTLAVVTKLDLMDHGTDAMDILYGRGVLIDFVLNLLASKKCIKLFLGLG